MRRRLAGLPVLAIPLGTLPRRKVRALGARPLKLVRKHPQNHLRGFEKAQANRRPSAPSTRPNGLSPSSGTAYSKEDSRSAASQFRSLNNTSKKSQTRFQPTACSSSTSKKAGNHCADSSQSRFPDEPFPSENNPADFARRVRGNKKVDPDR